jgi:hypothetical protein
MAYTSVSKTDERKLVRVQLPPSALKGEFLKKFTFIHSWPEILALKGKDEQLSHFSINLNKPRLEGQGSRRLIF